MSVVSLSLLIIGALLTAVSQFFLEEFPENAKGNWKFWSGWKFKKVTQSKVAFTVMGLIISGAGIYVSYEEAKESEKDKQKLSLNIKEIIQSAKSSNFRQGQIINQQNQHNKLLLEQLKFQSTKIDNQINQTKRLSLPVPNEVFLSFIGEVRAQGHDLKVFAKIIEDSLKVNKNAFNQYEDGFYGFDNQCMKRFEKIDTLKFGNFFYKLRRHLRLSVYFDKSKGKENIFYGYGFYENVKFIDPNEFNSFNKDDSTFYSFNFSDGIDFTKYAGYVDPTLYDKHLYLQYSTKLKMFRLVGANFKLKVYKKAVHNSLYETDKSYTEVDILSPNTISNIGFDNLDILLATSAGSQLELSNLKRRWSKKNDSFYYEKQLEKKESWK